MLGSGGVATTWLAYDSDRELNVVIKQLHSEQIAQAARDEFAWASKIHLDRCAGVWDIRPAPAPGYLVHEFIEGDALGNRVRHEPPTLLDVRLVAAGVLGILSQLHARDYLHGDITPSNIIVDDDWQPSLIDFGLATSVGTKPRGGTPATMAPELLIGQAASIQSDLYSVACTLVQVMLGRPPYVGTPEQGADRDSTLRPPTEDEKRNGDLREPRFSRHFSLPSTLTRPSDRRAPMSSLRCSAKHRHPSRRLRGWCALSIQRSMNCVGCIVAARSAMPATGAWTTRSLS